MASCEDKPNQESPQEYDPQIDSIAAAPLPVISPSMVDKSANGREDPDTRSRKPSASEPDPGGYPDREPGTETGATEAADNRPPPGVPADPNIF